MSLSIINYFKKRKKKFEIKQKILTDEQILFIENYNKIIFESNFETNKTKIFKTSFYEIYTYFQQTLNENNLNKKQKKIIQNLTELFEILQELQEEYKKNYNFYYKTKKSKQKNNYLDLINKSLENIKKIMVEINKNIEELLENNYI